MIFLSFQKDIKVLAILALLIYTEIHIVKKQVVGICKKMGVDSYIWILAKAVNLG